METQYKQGELPKVVEAIALQFKLDPKYVSAWVSVNFPQIMKKEECGNCGASMVQYVYVLDCLDALLVYGMGKIIKERLKRGVPFSEANAVHLQTELNRYYSVPSRSTQCAKLGLITKVLNAQGKHDRRRGWLITTRGWDFLRGQPVPSQVKVFRNQIEERFDTTITISQAFQVHRDLVQRAHMNHKNPRNDYTAELDTYRPSDWFEVAGVQQGALL